MSSAADLHELEALCPWESEQFRSQLGLLRASTAEAARRFAADMRLLAALSAQVPRCPFDERGGTPWTSFRREVAVARSLSDQAAEAELHCARMLTAVLPRMMALLEAGAATVHRARVFVTETGRYDDALATLIDAELAERAVGLPPWRIAQEVHRAADRLDAEAAALRVASRNAGRRLTVQPGGDDQAVAVLTGPAVPVTRWYATVDGRARALKATGDPRTLAQLRFDLATSTFPCDVHPPADPTAAAPAAPAFAEAAPGAAEPADAAAAGSRPAFVEPASVDCRRTRPVQASIAVPVETCLGLSNDPAWLDGYGWLSAPTTRLLLLDAELRRVCVQAGTGALVDRAERDVRPPPTPAGLRQSLLDMALDPIVLTDTGFRQEDRHDPSPPLRDHVTTRDRFCDGPTGTRTPAGRADLDHEIAHPHGPTAAWNLVARARRTHQLKHYGWTPLRTPTSTLWFTPAGQIVEVPRHQHPPPGIDPDPDGDPPSLPDPDQLTALDRAQLQPRTPDDDRPWLPATERDTTPWTWLEDDPPF